MMNNGRMLFDPSDSALVERLLKKNIREREEGLMVAVLGDAIECYQKYFFAKDEKGKKLFQETEEWILEKNSDWFFSFDNICELLSLHPDYIRRGLLCWKEASSDRRSEIKMYSESFKRKKKKAA
ncbi:MAG: hypothetical protein ACREQ7_21740 [Candidatus Binatia bacterium]